MKSELLEITRLTATLHALNLEFERTRGMSLAQAAILGLIAEMPGTGASELAEAASLSPGTLTQALKRLRKKNWLDLTTDPLDSRRHRIVLTRDGKRAIDEFRRVNHKELQAFESLRSVIGEIQNRLPDLHTQPNILS